MIGFFAFVVILVAGVLALVGGLQWIGHRREALPVVDRDQLDRLDRLESALASLESRLDQLQEEQKFLERLLIERPRHKSLEAGEGREPATDEVDSILFDTDEGEGAEDR